MVAPSGLHIPYRESSGKQFNQHMKSLIEKEPQKKENLFSDMNSVHRPQFVLKWHPTTGKRKDFFSQCRRSNGKDEWNCAALNINYKLKKLKIKRKKGQIKIERCDKKGNNLKREFRWQSWTIFEEGWRYKEQGTFSSFLGRTKGHLLTFIDKVKEKYLLTRVNSLKYNPRKKMLSSIFPLGGHQSKKPRAF